MAEKNRLILLDFKIHRLFSFSGGFPQRHVGMFAPLILSKQQSNADGMKKMTLLLIICSFLELATGQEVHSIEWFAKSDTLAPHKPVPFAGQEDWRDFLQAHLRYPQLALENCIEGKVMLLLRFSEQGGVESAEIVKGIGYGCDEEAHRLAMMLSAPAGMSVTSNLKLGIRFRLQ